jgi:hypothetical protein
MAMEGEEGVLQAADTTSTTSISTTSRAASEMGGVRLILIHKMQFPVTILLWVPHLLISVVIPRLLEEEA